jgi:hypothetical protein
MNNMCNSFKKPSSYVMLYKGDYMFLHHRRHSGDNLSPGGDNFIPGLGIIHPGIKNVISSDRTLFPKNHDKNTKKPTGELKITILF